MPCHMPWAAWTVRYGGGAGGGPLRQGCERSSRAPQKVLAPRGSSSWGLSSFCQKLCLQKSWRQMGTPLGAMWVSHSSLLGLGDTASVLRCRNLGVGSMLCLWPELSHSSWLCPLCCAGDHLKGVLYKHFSWGSHCRAVPITGIDIEGEHKWKSRGWITQFYSQDYPKFELLTKAEGVAEILTWAGSAVECFRMLRVLQPLSGRCTLFLIEFLCTRNVNVILSVKPRLNSKHFLRLFLDAFLSRI